MTQNDEGSIPGNGPADVPFADSTDARVFSSVDLDVPIDELGDQSAAPAPDHDRPRVELTVHPPDNESGRLDVDQPRFMIGSRGGADLAVDDPFISRWHAQIVIDERGTVILEDLNSDNGVFLRIADEFALEDGDEIVAGGQKFVFRSTWEPGDGEDSRPDTRSPRPLGAPVAGSPVRLLRYFEGGVLAELHSIGDRLTIGREGTDVECPEDFDLSARHAEIVRDGEVLFLRDLDSDFGTFIRIENSVELVDGDRFVVGRTCIDVDCP